MNINEFFAEKEKRVYPVFVTTRDLTVNTYVWIMGCDPYQLGEVYTIPKGTEMVVSAFSNFGEGHSMHLVSPRKVFNGKGTMNRWFDCKYEDMEYLEHRWTTD